MWKSKKIYSALAFTAALAMLASGCSSSDDNDTNNGDTTSASVNVIGDPDSSDDSNAVTVTDENGEAVTGAAGNVLTEPSVTEPLPSDTLSEEDILNAIAATETSAPQLNISQTNTERYGYSTLTTEEKKLYDDIVAGIEGLRYKICDEDAYTLEEWSKIYGLVYMQEPRLFYMNAKLKVGKLFYLTKD
ncbi:MAG: hypothetical protein K2N26_07770, partial [Oscillospiraceae bacterium]|nr:hypothetical protein [Oscillospiraceae bacterium]